MAGKRKLTVLNYRVIVEPDEYTGTEKPCFAAFCPTLGVADEGETVEGAIENLKSLMRFHLECLVEEGEEIPSPDEPEGLVTMTRVDIQGEPRFADL